MGFGFGLRNRLAGAVGELSHAAKPLTTALSIPFGRLRYLGLQRPRFTGAYRTRQQAIAAVPRGAPVGYDNDIAVDASFEEMCRIAPWDYPVLFWLTRLRPQLSTVLDAGGHMGTKYRAFRGPLDLDNGLRWVVYDVPAVVRAGRRRASEDGLTNLQFVDTLEGLVLPDLFLGSGLLQYLDVSLAELLDRLPGRPPHLLLNKVALRDGEAVFTLEGIGGALVPYHIRSREAFSAELAALGYSVEDEWQIPSLGHVIPTHPELGRSESVGMLLRYGA